MAGMSRPPSSTGMTRPSSSTSSGMTRPTPTVESEVRTAVVQKLAKLSDRQWSSLSATASAYQSGKIREADATSFRRTLRGYFPAKYKTSLGGAFVAGTMVVDVSSWFAQAAALRQQRAQEQATKTAPQKPAQTQTTSVPLDFQPSNESQTQISTTVAQPTGGRTKLLVLGGALLTAGVAAWLMLRKR